MSKIPENRPNTDAIGRMEPYNLSNVAPTESYKISEGNIVLLQPFEHQQICKPTYKIGHRRSAYSFYLSWMIHTTLPITQLHKSQIRANKTPYWQEATLPIGVPSHTTMEVYVLITPFKSYTVMSLSEAPCAKTSWRALLFRAILGITGRLQCVLTNNGSNKPATVRRVLVATNVILSNPCRV